MTPNQMIKILDGQLSDCYDETSKRQERIDRLEDALQSILAIPNSEAAQGIMKVLADDAIKANEVKK
jgi:hypothetical protein